MVDVVAAVLAFLGAIVLAVASGDDAITNAGVTFENVNTGVVIFIMIIVVLCFGIGAYGAVQFNTCMVSTALACHVVSLIGNLAALNVGGVILGACFIYPHVGFLMEMRRGIMTPDNYVNEMHSCCCV